MNGHVGSDANGYEGIHGGCGYGVRNEEGNRFLEMVQGLDISDGHENTKCSYRIQVKEEAMYQKLETER